MFCKPAIFLQRVGLLIGAVLAIVNGALAQVSGPPSANCHVTDGTFTACPNGKTEWSDVTPLAFPASDSFLYVNQDTSHTFLYLMYDLPLRTTPLGAADSVRIHFDTVETQSGVPALVVYDIDLFGNGQVSILENGQPTPLGTIVGAIGFGPSPNSATAHVTAELQVPLAVGLPPSTYSPDPIFWGAFPPPPPPPPPPVCKLFVLGHCLKTQAQVDTWKLEAAAQQAYGEAILTGGLLACSTLGNRADPKAASDLAAAETQAQAALVALGAYFINSSSEESAISGVESTLAQAQAAGILGTRFAVAVESGLEAYSAVGNVILAAQVAGAVDALGNAVVEVVQAVGACEAAVYAIAAPYFARSLAYTTLANDPPDSNFTVIATPVVPSLSAQPLTTAGGLSAQVAKDSNSLLLNLEQQIALLQVIPISINRAAGAAVAGDAFWQAQQVQAAQKYASQLIPLLQSELSLETALTNDFDAGGPVLTFSSDDVHNQISQIAQVGFPTDITTDLTQLGLNSTDQAAVLQAVLSADPVEVASLGTGAFPQSFSDPSFAAATNDAINSFFELAGPAVTIFSDFGSGFASNSSTNGPGWCVSGNATPDCGPLVDRWVAAPFTPAATSTLGQVDLALGHLSGTNGAIIDLVNSASGLPGTNVLESWTVSGLPTGCGFCSSPLVTLRSSGGVTLTSGNQYWIMVKGIAPDTLDFWWGNVESLNGPPYETNNDGASWYTLPNEPGSLTAFDVLSVPNTTTISGPVTTATAAVVEANANGDTVANLRGLAPTDAPTLQDQIQMIVQYRVIQNPTTDATQLTTQLVNSLPPSVLPPDQASAIIDAVTKNLAPPPPVISGMPGPGCSLWPPNGKLVHVATVMASDAVGGLLQGSFTVTGTSNEPSGGASNPEIVITPNGPDSYVVQLQARRLGTGNGRVYTLTATAKNSLGVATTATATCTVPHDQGQQ